MLQNSNHQFLLALADILAGNQVEDASLSRALELICKEVPFQYGVLYETDVTGRFSLTGSFSPHAVPFPSQLHLEELTPPDNAVLSHSEITYITKKPQNTPLELWMLELCSAESVVLAPIPDENGALYGLVFLCGGASGLPLNEEELHILFAALSTLARYVEMRMYQRKLNQAQVTMESILDNMGIDIYVNDFHTHEVLYVNKSMAAPYGGRKQFMRQKCWQTLFPEQSGPCEFCPQHRLIDSQGLPTKVYTWDYQRPFDNAWFRVFSAAFRWVDGRLAHVISSVDITENKRNEALVENLANYDQLTKLPNRRMLVKECERRIDKASAIEQGYLLFFDIDGFKAINDSLGHDAGDEFLIQLGAFFSGIPLLENAIYRNGGDEFVAIIGGDTVLKSNIRMLADSIHKRFEKPWLLKKGEVTCSTSIGVACYPEDGVTAEVLLQKADMAMYQVKKAGGGGLCFGYQLGDSAAAKKP